MVPALVGGACPSSAFVGGLAIVARVFVDDFEDVLHAANERHNTVTTKSARRI